jgi:hypothetical protein
MDAVGVDLEVLKAILCSLILVEGELVITTFVLACTVN